MDQQLKDIEEIFEDADVSLIKEIIYFDGWSTYEESWNYIIFLAIDDSIQLVEYGSSVMAEDSRNYFELEEITEEQSKELISTMNEAIKEL